ncbi:histidine kinase [Mongoliitalea lutea]|uniref:Histidine kinase n=1 Tax=Mongoliitalea lutea TaxID=849756 RepID=A0A8J3G4G7_9BACT|nr:histidine kinase [Mongoliitalea lutea]
MDNQGIRWYATDIGLYAYNGFVFEKMPLEGAKANSVTNVLQGKNGEIWCRNFSSQLFKRAGNRMIHFKALDKIIDGGSIIDMFVDEDELIIVTEHKIIWVKDAMPMKVHSLVMPSGQHIHYASTHQGEIYLSLKSKKVVKVSNKKQLKYLEAAAVKDLAPGRLISNQDDLYLVTQENGKVKIFNYDERVGFRFFSQLDSQDRLLNAVAQDDKIAILTSSKVILLDKEKRMQVLQTGARMSDFITDKAGTLLFSSLDNGLYEASVFGGEVAHSLEGYHFDVLHTSNGYLYASDNSDALWRFDKTLNNKDLLVTKSNSEIQFIAFDAQQKELFFSSGIVGNPISFYFGKSVAFTPSHVMAGYHNGLYRVPREWILQDKLKNVKNTVDFFQPLEAFKIRKERVRQLLMNGDELLVAFADSLISYTVTNQSLVPRKSWPIFGTDILNDPNGAIWVSTTNDGLWIMEQDELALHAKQEHEVIGTLNIRLVAGNGWMALLTDKGINIFERRSDKIHLKNFIDLSKLVAYDLALYNDQFILSTDLGLITIPTDPNPKGTYHRMKLNQVLIDGEVVPVKNQLKIPHTFKSLTFDWSNISFDPRVEFYYQLSPIQEQITAHKGESTSISFYALQHGNYTFRLFSKVQGDESVFEEFTFVVLKPWYLRIWFWFLILGLAAVIVMLIIKIIKQRMRNKQLYDQKLIISELRAIRSQMNPHFLYNALNSLQGMIYAGKINESALYVSKFSDFLRQVLTNSEKQILPLTTEIQSIRTYLEIELERFYDDFNYEIIVDQYLNMTDEIPTMIIQPFVENAIKHGLMNRSEKGRELILKFDRMNKGLRIEIVDNGVGIQVSQQINEKRKDKPSSFATKAIDDRIHLMNQQGNFEIRYTTADAFPDSNYVGTRVIITIQSNKS